MQEGAPEGIIPPGSLGRDVCVDSAKRADQGKGLRVQRSSHLMCREWTEKHRGPRNSRKELVLGRLGHHGIEAGAHLDPNRKEQWRGEAHQLYQLRKRLRPTL